jgi:glycosyltransferase involved in cell wall biosynthesis
MNILYLGTTQQFSASNAGFTHTYNFAKSVRDLGHNIYIIFKPDKPENQGKKLVYNGIPIHLEHYELESTMPDLLFNSPKLIKFNTKIQKWVKDYKIDIIHERMEVPGGFATYSKKLTGLPVLLEANDAFLFDISSMNKLDRILYKKHLSNRKKQLNSCTRLLTQTEILKKIFALDTNVQIEVVPNAADPEMFSPKVEARREFDNNMKVIGFAGANRKWHGVEDLLKAFMLVRKKMPNAKLVLIGKDLDEYDDGKSIHSPGAIQYSEMPSYLSGCDVLVAPFNTKYDERRAKFFQKYGMWWSPLKIFEYMAMGKPVVSSNVGAIGEYIDEAGVTYKEGDVSDLALKILNLLENEELSIKLGKKGRQKVISEYNWENQARKILGIYQELHKGN